MLSVNEARERILSRFQTTTEETISLIECVNRVLADIPTGSVPTVTLTPVQSARIITGSQIPPGADAVIPVEDTDFNNRSANSAGKIHDANSYALAALIQNTEADVLRLGVAKDSGGLAAKSCQPTCGFDRFICGRERV